MELNDFKDCLFEALNDADSDIFADIEADDKNNIFRIKMADGKLFEVECRQAN